MKHQSHHYQKSLQRVLLYWIPNGAKCKEKYRSTDLLYLIYLSICLSIIYLRTHTEHLPSMNFCFGADTTYRVINSFIHFKFASSYIYSTPIWQCFLWVRDYSQQDIFWSNSGSISSLSLNTNGIDSEGEEEEETYPLTTPSSPPLL